MVSVQIISTGTSRLAVLHASVFCLGIVALLIGVVTDRASLLLLAGPCLIASGALIWTGSRIALAAPFGDLLRLALGRTRLMTLHLRAIVWIAVGLLITAWAVERLRHPRDTRPVWQGPLATASIHEAKAPAQGSCLARNSAVSPGMYEP